MKKFIFNVTAGGEEMYSSLNDHNSYPTKEKCWDAMFKDAMDSANDYFKHGGSFTISKMNKDEGVIVVEPEDDDVFTWKIEEK